MALVVLGSDEVIKVVHVMGGFVAAKILLIFLIKTSFFEAGNISAQLCLQERFEIVLIHPSASQHPFDEILQKAQPVPEKYRSSDPGSQ